METHHAGWGYHQHLSLYSLEKLIEWKPVGTVELAQLFISLYSLEKLIEWKPDYAAPL